MKLLMLQLGTLVDVVTLTEMVIGQFMVTVTLLYTGVILIDTIVVCRTDFGAPWTSLPWASSYIAAQVRELWLCLTCMWRTLMNIMCLVPQSSISLSPSPSLSGTCGALKVKRRVEACTILSCFWESPPGSLSSCMTWIVSSVPWARLCPATLYIVTY